MEAKEQSMFKAYFTHFTLLVISLFFTASCYADGSAINKIYLPYVQPLEKEVEYRALFREVEGEKQSQHKLGYGASITENWFAEFYLIGEKTEEEFIVSNYEAEAILQLTEQGEFEIDWGMMFELERSANADDAWEASIGMLAVKNFKKISIAANAFLIREWGKDVMAELEQAGSVQARYRLLPEFEPGFELYKKENEHAAGPVIMGRFKVGSRQKLFWQLGLMFEDSDQGSDEVLQLQLEYEFL